MPPSLLRLFLCALSAEQLDDGTPAVWPPFAAGVLSRRCPRLQQLSLSHFSEADLTALPPSVTQILIEVRPFLVFQAAGWCSLEGGSRKPQLAALPDSASRAVSPACLPACWANHKPGSNAWCLLATYLPTYLATYLNMPIPTLAHLQNLELGEREPPDDLQPVRLRLLPPPPGAKRVLKLHFLPSEALVAIEQPAVELEQLLCSTEAGVLASAVSDPPPGGLLLPITLTIRAPQHTLEEVMQAVTASPLKTISFQARRVSKGAMPGQGGARVWPTARVCPGQGWAGGSLGWGPAWPVGWM